MTLGDHPGQQGQGVHRTGICCGEALVQHRCLDGTPKGRPLLDRGDMQRAQGAAHHQAHVPAVADQALGPAGGQGVGGGLVGGAVVANRASEGRNIGVGDQVAELMGCTWSPSASR
jgi:hypothetical protein